MSESMEPAVGGRVRITGDTQSMFHGRAAGTLGTVTALDDRTVVVRVDGAGEWYVGRADIEVLGESVDVVSLLRAEVTTLREEVATVRARLTEALRQASEGAASLAGLKNRVRDAAIEHAGGNAHCAEGLNEWLVDLGLDPYHPRWTFEVCHHGHAVVSGEIPSDAKVEDKDAAVEWVRGRMSASTQRAEVTIELEVGEESGTFDIEDDDVVDDDWVDSYLDDLDVEVERAG